MLREIKGIKGRPFAEIETAVYQAMNNRFGGISQALTGKGATRTVVEQLFDIAPNWLRARASVYINAFKGSGPERYIALNMIGRELATAAALSTGLSWLFMKELPGYDPRKFDFLGVKTPIGTIPTIPSISLMRLVAREAGTLGDFLVETAKGEPDFSELASDTFRNFQRTIKGRESPALSIVTDQAFGQDFLGRPVETAEQRATAFLKGLLPIFGEDIVEAIQEGAPPGEVAARGAVGFAGVSVFPTSAFNQLNEAFREETGRDWDGSEAARRVAEASDVLRPKLEAFDKEARERGFEPAIQREERGQVLGDLAENLRPLVEGVRADESRAGEQFRREFSTFKAQAFAISLRDVLGVDFPEPDTELGRLVEQYNTTEPERDPETFQMDWATFDRERDAILAEIGKIAPEVVAALQTRLRLPEEFQDVEQQFQRAAVLRDQLGDKPLYIDLRPQEHDTVRRFLSAVKRQRDTWFRNDPDAEQPSLEEAIRIKAQDWEVPQAALDWALCIRSSQSSCAVQNRNPEYDQFIIDNQAGFEPFYSGLVLAALRRQAAGVR